MGTSAVIARVPAGVLLVDKPAGITSHDVVARARRIFNTRKVGHAGTLDPMATGVLVLGINSGTRLPTRVIFTPMRSRRRSKSYVVKFCSGQVQ